MDVGAGRLGFRNQFAVGIDVDVIFVAILIDVAFSGPVCVCVFLGFLALVIFAFPFFRDQVFFDLYTLFGGVALAGCFDKCYTNDSGRNWS